MHFSQNSSLTLNVKQEYTSLSIRLPVQELWNATKNNGKKTGYTYKTKIVMS